MLLQLPVLFRCGGVRGAWAVPALLALLATGASAQTGAIEGRVVRSPEPARRTASHYPSGGASARVVQSVPVLAFLRGGTLASDPARPSAGAASVELLQRDTMFVPAALVVRTGTEVRFPNDDPFFHNVFSYSANARFDLGRYPQGETRSVVLAEPGLTRIFCEVHASMRAVVLVTDHGYHAVVEESGAFRIDAVPPGDYTVVVYHPDVGETEVAVRVSPGATTAVELALR